MSAPTVEFTADECQALFDLFNRLLGVYRPDEVLGITKEEIAAIFKLRDAAKFYASDV